MRESFCMRGSNERNSKRSGHRWPGVLWSSVALVPVLALVAATGSDELWLQIVGTISILQLYLVIAAWAWMEGGRKPQCHRNHLVEGGRWQCKDSHQSEFRVAVTITALLGLGCFALVPSQGLIGPVGVFGLLALGAFVYAAAYGPQRPQ